MVLLSIVITLLLISCASNKQNEKYVVKTVYEVVPLYFYDFPSLKDAITIPLDAEGNVVRDNETEIVNVVIPYWYVQRLAEFSLHYQETIHNYNTLKELKEEMHVVH